MSARREASSGSCADGVRRSRITSRGVQAAQRKHREQPASGLSQTRSPSIARIGMAQWSGTRAPMRTSQSAPTTSYVGKRRRSPLSVSGAVCACWRLSGNVICGIGVVHSSGLVLRMRWNRSRLANASGLVVSDLSTPQSFLTGPWSGAGVAGPSRRAFRGRRAWSRHRRRSRASGAPCDHRGVSLGARAIGRADSERYARGTSQGAGERGGRSGAERADRAYARDRHDPPSDRRPPE